MVFKYSEVLVQGKLPLMQEYYPGMEEIMVMVILIQETEMEVVKVVLVEKEV